MEETLAEDMNGYPIRKGDYVRFPGSATEVEGVVYGIKDNGCLLIAVPRYGTYGLWPSNSERVESLLRIVPLIEG